MGEAARRREVLLSPGTRALIGKIQERARRAALAIGAGNGDGAYDEVLALLGWAMALQHKLGVRVEVLPLQTSLSTVGETRQQQPLD